MTFPQDWRSQVAHHDFLAAARARSRRVSGFVEVLDDDDVVLARLGSPERDPDVLPATHPGPVDAQVTCDGDAQVRWTARLDLDQDDLAPRARGDLLHPWSWHRVRFWWSLWVPAWSSWAHVPCGTMYVDDPSVTEDGGAHVPTSLRLSDAAALVKAARMPSSLSVGGTDAALAAADVLTADCPWLPVSVEALGHRLPAGYEAGEPDADPWDVAEQIVTSAGGVLRTDRMGVVRIGPAPQGLHVADMVEGEGCQVTSVTPEVALSEVCNEVTVTSGARQDADGEELDPISSTWRDSDPSSPTWVGHGHVMRAATITADEVVTQAQADDLAAAHGRDLVTPTERVAVEHLPMPWLDPGDLVGVAFARVGVSGSREVRAWDLVWGADGGQRTEVVGRRS